MPIVSFDVLALGCLQRCHHRAARELTLLSDLTRMYKGAQKAAKWMSYVLFIARGIVDLVGAMSARDEKVNILKHADNNKAGRGRRIAETDKIPLSRVKEVCAKLKELSGKHVSVNDVLLATLNKTFERYYAGQGDAILQSQGKVTIAIPMSLRSNAEGLIDSTLWNNIGMSNIPLIFGLAPVQTVFPHRHPAVALCSSGLRTLLGIGTENSSRYRY